MTEGSTLLQGRFHFPLFSTKLVFMGTYLCIRCDRFSCGVRSISEVNFSCDITVVCKIAHRCLFSVPLFKIYIEKITKQFSM